jgi:hypothetical protein
VTYKALWYINKLGKGLCPKCSKSEPEYIKAMKLSRTGRKMSDEARRKMSEAKTGDKHPAWLGGITPEERRDRKGVKYKNWRKNILIRDKYCCQICREVGGSLEAHHIVFYVIDKAKRLDEKNGVTLCKKCHKGIHSIIIEIIKLIKQKWKNT